jgi:hypothetical protein
MPRPPERILDSTIDSAIHRTQNTAMGSLTANDLKTRGVAAIEESLAEHPEAVISVRGKDRFVVMEMAQYRYLRECELDAALVQSREDVAAGRYVVESAQQHVERLQSVLAAQAAQSPQVRRPAKRVVSPPPSAKRSKRSAAR